MRLVIVFKAVEYEPPPGAWEVRNVDRFADQPLSRPGIEAPRSLGPLLHLEPRDIVERGGIPRATIGAMRAFTIAVLMASACGSAPPTVTSPAARPATATTPAWPGVTWDRAEAVLFNQVPYGPGIEHLDLRAWDPENGLNPSIVESKPIARALANRAIELVTATGGGVEVSKCPFPRHAIVLFRGQQPVASASVCFECGDILVSPDPRPPIEEGRMPADPDAQSRAYGAQMVVYDQVYPRWQALFRDDLGFSIIPPARVQPRGDDRQPKDPAAR